MSIVVFWLDAPGQPAQAEFAQTELLTALQFAEDRRREGKRHVCLSTELSDRVGGSGVAAVEEGRLPSGEVYDFSKAHRGGGPGTPGKRR